MTKIKIYNDDCFNHFKKVKAKSIDLFILDLPYNQTACKWDKDIIDLDKMWLEIKRVMKPTAVIVMFCTAKFGYRLIHSNPKWFKYDLIWKKSKKVGFLSANKMPLRQHELVYIFKDKQGTYNPQKTEGKPYTATRQNSDIYSDKIKHKPTINKGDRHPTSIIENEDLGEIAGGYYRGEGKKPFKRMPTHPTERHPTSIIETPTDHENLYVFSNARNDDIELTRNKILREYAGKVKKYINKPLKTINKDIGNQGIHHFYSFASSQFGIPTEINYKKLIDLYNIDKMPEFINYDKLKKLWKTDANPSTYNPQKTEGKPYKSKERIEKEGVYTKDTYKRTATKDTKERHPTSIIEEPPENTFLEFNNPHKTIHRTQKPVDLLEWLIKTYSNEGETVMDFTMGGGSTGIACLNTKRNFIGVEKDEEIFKLAKNRIESHQVVA